MFHWVLQRAICIAPALRTQFESCCFKCCKQELELWLHRLSGKTNQLQGVWKFTLNCHIFFNSSNFFCLTQWPQVLVTAAALVESNDYFKFLACTQSVLSGNQLLLTESIFCKPFSLQVPKYAFFTLVHHLKNVFFIAVI